MNELKPKTLLDIGSNRGWFSQLAASRGTQVIATDIDEPALTKLFHDAGERNLPMLPLVSNFRNPEPGRGLCGEAMAPATRRLACDMVMSLALTHHLIYKQGMRFEQIVAGMSIFARRWLLVEFIDRQDKYVSQWWTEQYAWCTLENFQAELGRVFRSIRRFPSNLEHRTLLLCER